MRELHGWHGDHGRHARDGHAAADHPLTRAHDGPKHAAHDALKLRMLTDSAARIAERIRYQQKVDSANADYAARHAKPKNADRGQAPEQLKPQRPNLEHTPPETRERRPADRETRAALAEVEERTGRLPDQAAKKQKPERPWLPRTDTFKMLGGNSLAIASIAVATDLIPSTWEQVGISVVAAIAGNVTWANRRWKGKHGNRPEGRAGDQDDARPRDTA